MPTVSRTTPPPPPGSSQGGLPTQALRRGMSGQPVRKVQEALVALGFLSQEKFATGPGKFGPGTEQALKDFQASRGLEADGVYGPKTRAAMTQALGGVVGSQPQPSQPSQPPKPAAKVDGLYWSDGFAKTVALTFDDGPHPVNTPKVLDLLERFNVKATFFVTGANAEKYPELVKRIVAEGHSLGNHSWNHADLSKTDAAGVKSDLARAQAAIDKALGRHYDLTQVRAPYGAMDDEVKATLRQGGDAAVMWNVDSSDWRFKNDDQAILKSVFEGSSSVYARGGVILFHDIHPQTVRVLDDVIERLQREGFSIQKTDALLQKKYGSRYA